LMRNGKYCFTETHFSYIFPLAFKVLKVVCVVCWKFRCQPMTDWKFCYEKYTYGLVFTEPHSDDH
jgi:hypothetical protein